MFQNIFNKVITENVLPTSVVASTTAEVNPIILPSTLNPNGWTIVCISDTHNQLHKMAEFIPPADIVLHAGDFSSTGDLADIKKFKNQFGSLPHPAKIFIAGNHDLTLDTQAYAYGGLGMRMHRYKHGTAADTNFYANYSQQCIDTAKKDTVKDGYGTVRYLMDESCRVQIENRPDIPELKIYGTPWQPEFCGWGFNLPRGRALAQKWDAIPNDVDILITHTPPEGILDKNLHGESCGCEELRKNVHLKKYQPRVHTFGHIHEDYGVEVVESTMFINAATCTVKYKPTNTPIVIFVPHDKSQPAQVLSAPEPPGKHD
jgi:predicted phosphodiesterase